MKIEYVDPIYAKITPAVDIYQIKKCFEYASTRWKQGAYSRTQEIKPAYYFGHPHKGWFHAGLIPKVIEYCNRQGIEIEASKNPFVLKSIIQASLPGIIFRQDQLRLIDYINEFGRGIVKSPPGSGKTVLAGAIISQYPDVKAIFIVHTQALFNQTIEEFTKWFGEENVGWIGQNGFNPKKITVIMIQTAYYFFNEIKRKQPKQRKIPENETEDQKVKREKKWKKQDSEKYKLKLQQDKEKSIEEKNTNRKILIDLLTDVEILIVDEVHHTGVEEGYYASIFERCLASIRIGFTATTLPPGKRQLVCEGYVGPVIGELTMNEGINQGILAKPRLKLIPVPKFTTEYKTYKDLYKYQIILNKVRNRLVVKEAADQIRQGKSVLIMITDVVNNHGGILQNMLFEFHGFVSTLVKGGMGAEASIIKMALQSKEIKCVIVTSAWREGVNIPSLDCIINAIGNESEITVLQAIGRGLRTSEGKEEILIIDFLDPYKYLAEHTIARLKIYNEMGILNA